MDFFGRQAEAVRNTRRFLLWFAVALLAMVTLIYLLVAWALLAFGARDRFDSGLWQPDVLLAVAATTGTIVFVASTYKVRQLRAGGAFVATMLGGRPVDPATDDLRERTLINVVEEMAIASGNPVPQVFVLDREAGMNAFAAGWGPSDAAVAVTRGLLERLDRDELQGVVAHEFSHIAHGDMRLNIRLMGMLFGILVIATIGRIVVETTGRGRIRGRGGKDGGAAALVLLGVGLIVIGWLGVLCARIIKAAVSRQREFLADAAAVQYTRNPRGLGLALARIAGLGSRLQSAHAEEASHMLFANGVASWFGSVLATHPPIDERIERVLPGFRSELTAQQDRPAAANAAAQSRVIGPAGVTAPAVAGLLPAAIVQSIGEPSAIQVTHAKALLARVPLEIHAACRGTALAQPLCCALLLDAEPQARRTQLALLERRAEPHFVHETARLSAELQPLPVELRQVILDLAVPALRGLATEQRQALRSHLRALALADGRLTPLELVLLKTLERHLPLPDEAAARRRLPATPLLALAGDTALVLSVLAHFGHPHDQAAAERAFQEGCQALDPIGDKLRLAPAGACDPAALDAALTRLDAASPLARRQILLACARAVGHDGVVQADEGVLLRAIAESWGCPLPPVWPPRGAPAVA